MCVLDWRNIGISGDNKGYGQLTNDVCQMKLFDYHIHLHTLYTWFSNLTICTWVTEISEG